MDNLENDLAVGLDLSFEQAKRILLEGKIERLKQAGEAFFEQTGPSDQKRRIPVGSFEKIMEERMLELFGIIRDRADVEDHCIGRLTGVVLSGGGGLLPPLTDYAQRTFGLHVRRGDPLAFAGAMTGLDNPRCSALLGGLRFALEVNSASTSQLSILKVADALEDLTGELMKKMRNVTRVFKK